MPSRFRARITGAQMHIYVLPYYEYAMLFVIVRPKEALVK